MNDMGAYFIRHTDNLAVSREVISQLHRDNIVAIHFPGDGPQDSTSILPSDYSKRADRHAISMFTELSKQGGYVWAQYYTNEDSAKVGRIVSGTEIKLRTEKWDSPRRSDRLGSPAILKTLQMTNVRTLHPREMQALRAIRPRQGTISRWPSARALLRAAVDRSKLELKWENLSPAQQEIAFSEFLREHDLPEFPRLEMLLMPPGRTLKDVDLYGVAKGGGKVFAQVTFSHLEETTGKQAHLSKYADPGNHLIFLCTTPDPLHRDGDLWILPVHELEAWLQAREEITRHFLDEFNQG